MRLQVGSIVAACALSTVLAQELPPPAYGYEVVSIRAADPNERNSGFGRGAQGGLRVRNKTAQELLAFAYDVREFQLVGVPAWARSERYEINLTPDRADLIPDGPVSPSQLEGWLTRNRQRMQAVLRDRFSLALHSDTRELNRYVLTVSKGGHKLAAPANPARGTSFNMNNGQQITATSSTMKMLAGTLASILGHYVQDKTGLDGSFDFKLEFAPVSSGLPARADEANDTGRPSIFTALTEQAGLRLESEKGPVPVLVIEKLEKPSGN
jgi:uncharacterized protein (TIGR03435 family)